MLIIIYITLIYPAIVLMQVVHGVRTVFRSGRTLPIEWRLHQLTRMMQMLDERKDEFVTALHQDLNKVT